MLQTPKLKNGRSELEAKILQKICQASNLKVQYRNILRRSLWTQSHFHITTEVNKFPPFGGQYGRCKIK
ncbi:3904_t:CDS:2 [Rhizophagus irregularis]|uniref:Uncharacterized protein n=1 Tax=Rhizophagus irregularis (strain DAOM 197198w) TaxID=1432141 RepID=A0A015N5C6_RHIIW|nr:hypothetical protein RirG_051860 [Rhizophagus irregularis DAOM 197198w]CAG8499501.1 3904_t:CDS:2 [Rhizophagus irregularis]